MGANMKRAMNAVTAVAVLVAFAVVALVAACRPTPDWHERPDRPLQSGRQDAPYGGDVRQQ